MGFNIGQRVKRRSTGELGRIFAGPTEAGYFDVQFLETDETVPASDLEALEAVDSGPLELLKAGKFGTLEEHDLFLRAAVLNHAFQYDSRSGLSNARIEPKLHQIFVMLRVLGKTAPRMILADEVGLGKTIEAGLLIKELRSRKLAERVLILTPASLVEQWRNELESKFNESFDVFDAAALEHIGRGRHNPWLERDNIICSLPFAVRHGEEITACHWDVVIIDEAHKASRRRHGKSWETKRTWEFADELKDSTNGLLLLTATPMQVHESQLYSLVDLIEPGLFGTFSQFMASVHALPELNEVMKIAQACSSWADLDRLNALTAHKETLSALGFVAADLAAELATQAACEQLLNELAARHPLADVLVRNRKREVMEGFQPRVPKTHPVEPTPEEMDLYDEITEYIRLSYNVAISKKDRAVGFLMVAFQKMLTSSSAAIKVSFEQRILKLQAILDGDVPVRKRRKKLSEDDVDELRDVAEASAALQEFLGVEFADMDDADFEASLLHEIDVMKGFVQRLEGQVDSKAKVLTTAMRQLLGDDPSEKVLIFTQFIETQMYLTEMLSRAGFSVDYFNGNMNLDEKERAVRRFRDSSQILVSTEAGGEGRNFQFCHIMVNYDLPWNPMRVEQRIGRIDRIGQKRPVEIHNLAVVGTLEQRVLEVLSDRIRLFEESVGSLDPILGEIEKEFEQLAMTGVIDKDADAFEFEEGVERRRREAMAREEAQADLAMDRNSFRKDEANRWLQRRPLADWSDLRDFVTEALGYFGGRISKGSSGATVIAISPALKTDAKLKRARYEGEFDPALALVEEPEEFFAVGHEVVDGLLSLAGVRDGRACSVVSEPELTGGPRVEIWYELLSRAGRPTGKLVAHRVGSTLDVESREVTAFPTARPRGRVDEPPGWVVDAVAASRSYLERVDLAEFGSAAAEEVDHFQTRELRRIKRIHDHATERLRTEREQMASQIAHLEATGTESQKKILPARRGALTKLINRTEQEQAQYEARVRELEALVSDHSARVIAATLVVSE